MRKEGKAGAAGVTAQDNMHWASCPLVQLRRQASQPARRMKAKIYMLAKFVSYIIRKVQACRMFSEIQSFSQHCCFIVMPFQFPFYLFQIIVL